MEKLIKLHEELMFVFQYNLHWMVGSVLRNLQAASELANEKAKMNEWRADTFTSSIGIKNAVWRPSDWFYFRLSWRA
jgi:hypothetical protein